MDIEARTCSLNFYTNSADDLDVTVASRTPKNRKGKRRDCADALSLTVLTNFFLRFWCWTGEKEGFKFKI